MCVCITHMHRHTDVCICMCMWHMWVWEWLRKFSIHRAGGKAASSDRSWCFHVEADSPLLREASTCDFKTFSLFGLLELSRESTILIISDDHSHKISTHHWDGSMVCCHMEMYHHINQRKEFRRKIFSAQSRPAFQDYDVVAMRNPSPEPKADLWSFQSSVVSGSLCLE